MIRTNVIDEFFQNQPEKTFQVDLHTFKIPIVHRRKASKSKNEFSPQEIYLDEGEFCNEMTLATSFSDFDNFLRENGLSGFKYPVRLKRVDGFEKEEFDCFSTPVFCEIRASEKEGIRRALIWLQDTLCVGGGYLQFGQTHCKPQIKRRITRCFFSPTNRPPKNGDELSDDIDYYPEAYLNRLMHDGINGIWIYSSFADLVKTSYIPEFGEGADARIEKLKGVVEKCERYGIEVFIFAMEPMSLTEGAITSKYPDIVKKYPQTHGNRLGDNMISFCTYTDFARGYCTEAVGKLFRSVPKLGGLMSITQGERITSCSNMWSNTEGVWSNNCPNCKDKKREEILSYTVTMMRKAIQEVKPQAEYISWTYGHREWNDDEIGYYVAHAPKNVALLQNFEDNGRVMQLGKKRIALDYWLSYVGPSHMFEHTAQVAREYGKRMYAKMQICCSHECASVPYIPVPGIVYDKLIRADELGVQGIMESWYFGNYPCLMSKAVELLSFGKRFADKREFLRYLAGLYWNDEDANAVVSAWEFFEAGYTQYPINTMFGYYGPMHDGIVWELSLLPKNFSLPRSWQLIDKTDGDRIGECLFNGHTVREAVTLLDTLNENWQKGCAALASTSVAKRGEKHEQLLVADALRILFRSGRNVMRFYELRNDLGYGRGEAKANFAELQAIVLEEQENCKKMIELCEADNRLGYHSEAEGFKFHPAKLRKKLRQLDELLENEFPIVEKRIEQGVCPIGYYVGEDDSTKHYAAGEGDLENAKWETLSNGDKFRVATTEDEIKIELFAESQTKFFISNEYELFLPQAQVILYPDGRVRLYVDCMTHQSYFDEKIDEELAKWSVESLSNEACTHLIVTLKKSEVGFIRLPYKMMVKSDGGDWCEDALPVRVLGKKLITPGWFGWIEKA